MITTPDAPSTIKILMRTESGLENLLISDLEQATNQLILQDSSFRDFYSRSITIKTKSLSSILPGFVIIEIIPSKSGKEFLVSENDINIKLYFSDVIYSTLTTLSIIWVLNEINFDQVITMRRDNSPKIKLDSFRIKEEIDFSLKVFQLYHSKQYLSPDKFSNISIFSNNKLINDSIQHQINDIALKQLNNKGLLADRKDIERDKFDPIFQIILNQEKCWICCNLQIKTFNNIIPYNMLIPHSTPIAPQTVNIMANTLGEMIIQFLKTNAQKEDSPKYNKIIFIDPFCGNGTIPLCIYTNPILLKMLINIGFKNINIFGMDMDESCIENCVSNLNSIKNGIPQSYASFQKFVQINFQTSSIEQIVKKLPFKISEPAIIPIITQPPYGLTIRKSESELQEIYLNLFNFASRLMEQHKIFLSFITINNQLITTILNKFKDQTDKNLISLHKTLKINKHDNEFGIFFWL